VNVFAQISGRKISVVLMRPQKTNMVFWARTRLKQRHTAKRLLDNSLTNQLAISQVADSSTRRQIFINH